MPPRPVALLPDRTKADRPEPVKVAGCGRTLLCPLSSVLVKKSPAAASATEETRVSLHTRENEAGPEAGPPLTERAKAPVEAFANGAQKPHELNRNALMPL